MTILNSKLDKNKLNSIIDKVNLSKIQSKLEFYFGKEYNSNGIILSGGEQQKLLIGRSLYSEKIIIMDEPTSDLDPKMETILYELLGSVFDEQIMLFISHKLASCKFCDEFIVIEDGRIIQNGTHEELVNVDGLYKKMWNSQLELYT
ncbi:hypothetical protein HZY86_09260 [Aerococcaceae bacterium DSM 111020]|nr:hypothetical protein [Aerococcaceae bacterium DSM 111020]